METDLSSIENKWRSFWDRNDTYAFTDDGKDKIFSIDTPPPTVSGELHMGHSFSYVHQDIIARYRRMRGFNVFYPMGLDENGLPTEKLAEKMLGRRGSDMPKEDFIAACIKAGEEGGKKIISIFSQLGISANLKNPYRTYSAESRRISQSMFLDLVEKKRAYREKGPVVVCPTCRTAISQIDMKDMQRETDFYFLRFEGLDGESIDIATTRPELLGACVAVFVNPDDERYKKMIGKTVRVPLYGYTVKVLSDPLVDPEKGTGAEMVCTFGDQNDAELWRKYSLPTRMVVDGSGRMLGDNFIKKGSVSWESRKDVVSSLRDQGLILKSERKKQTINVHERCDSPLEISILTQWYVRYMDLKEKLLEQGSRINWFPDHMKVRYNNWVTGLKSDWCISRQRIYGIPFPVWYCSNCGEPVFADLKELPVDPRFQKCNKKCKKCNSDSFVPDTDVMDTWATSSLSPRLATEPYGLRSKIKKMDVRFQGHDIITTWAFTTIVRSLLHDDQVPWNDISVSGNVMIAPGAKMSKSKGVQYSPEDFIKRFGVDAVRHWTSVAGNGEDIRIDEKDFLRGRRVVIKLLNAANLVQMLSGESRETDSDALDGADKWIMSKLTGLEKTVTKLLDSYNISRARIEIDDFFWNTFCDSYLEICKVRLRDTELTENEKGKTLKTLKKSFRSILLLYAPYLAFTTEEVFNSVFSENASVHRQSWPDDDIQEDEVSNEIDYVIEVVSMARSESAKTGKSTGREISVSGKKKLIEKNRKIIEGLLRSSIVDISESDHLEVKIQK